MLLTITTTHEPETDLGFLRHERPGDVRTVALGFGDAHVVFPEATVLLPVLDGADDPQVGPPTQMAVSSR